MIEADVITAEEEAELLAEWFDTVQFDVESPDLPPMEDEEDDEESRARALMDWFTGSFTEPVPAGITEWTWSLVDESVIGMSRSAAKVFLEKEQQFQELFGIRHLPGKHNQQNHGGGAGPKAIGLGGIKNRGKPTVVSRGEFDSRFPDNDSHLYRGVSSQDGAERARNGGLGDGDFGKGQYFGADIAIAQNYMQAHMGDQKGVMIRGAIDVSKGPKISKIPAKVRRDGSVGIDRWAEENEVDIIDHDNYLIVKNPAAMVMDSHDYTMDETVVLDYFNKGYTIPDEYANVADRLNDSRHLSGQRSEQRFFSQPVRSVQRVGDNCLQCTDNEDPGAIPVHPGCDCEVITDEIPPGVPPEDPAVAGVVDTASIVYMSDSDKPVAISLEPNSAMSLRVADLRWGDVARWMSQLPVETTAEFLSVVVDALEGDTRMVMALANSAEGDGQIRDMYLVPMAELTTDTLKQIYDEIKQTAALGGVSREEAKDANQSND